jgi:hypothetical protein
MSLSFVKASLKHSCGCASALSSAPLAGVAPLPLGHVCASTLLRNGLFSCLVLPQSLVVGSIFFAATTLLTDTLSSLLLWQMLCR